MDNNNISEIFNLSNYYQTWIVEDVKKKWFFVKNCGLN